MARGPTGLRGGGGGFDPDAPLGYTVMELDITYHVLYCQNKYGYFTTNFLLEFPYEGKSCRPAFQHRLPIFYFHMEILRRGKIVFCRRVFIFVMPMRNRSPFSGKIITSFKIERIDVTFIGNMTKTQNRDANHLRWQKSTSKCMHGMNQTEAEYSRHGKRSQRASLSQIGPVVLEE